MHHLRLLDATVAVTATATLLAGLLLAAPAPPPPGPVAAPAAAPAAVPSAAPVTSPAPRPVRAAAAVRPVRQVRPAAAPALPPAVLDRQRAAGLTCEATSSGLPLCHHGHDAAPPPLPEPFGVAGGDPGVPCYGDGTSGPRVRAVYARPQGSQDRYAATLPSFRRWAGLVDQQVNASAGRTGGRRHVRWATTSGSGCALAVLRVQLPASAFSSFKATVEALQAAGLRQPQSKYLVWADASTYCGIATSYADDTPGQANLNNGAHPSFARVDRGCWGKVEAHELVHMLGGVQPSARNATKGFHCSDGHDVMCYDDGTAGGTQRAVCPSSAATVLDCRNDDYFSTAPARGSYLDTHWNTARSAFLSASASGSGSTTGTSPAPSPTPSPTRSPSPSPSPTTKPLLPALPSLPDLPDLPELPGLLPSRP